MPEVRRHWLNEKVWIPLRASIVSEAGAFGQLGQRSEFYGVSSIAVSTEWREEAEALDWSDLDISGDHSGWVQDGRYHPADRFYGSMRAEAFEGLYLVLDQHINSAEPSVWHLHQDLVVTLDLIREGDEWVRPNEDYRVVARLKRDRDGDPNLLEIGASYLRDYLHARGMALYVSSYQSRSETVEDASHIGWDPNPLEERNDRDRWQGGVYPIHEGGMPYGGGFHVMNAAWKDEFTEGDVPQLGVPNDENMVSESWSGEDSGRKLFRIEGELWRTEWVEPAANSPIICRDTTSPAAFFTVDAEGNREGKDTLANAARWLWFRPEVMPMLAHRRGGSMDWFTRDTGEVRCSPDYRVHFGVNELGLVNVYAKDIATLPDWQQLIWAGFNTAPDGGVSAELLMSQVKADPANTQAPEAFLAKGLDYVSSVARDKLGIEILRRHAELPRIIERAHRFRATDLAGLLALAKDLARLTADSIDAAAIQTIVVSPKGERWGSMKSLEKLLAGSIGDAGARAMLGPLAGIYELRLADAHLPGDDLDNSLRLAGVDASAPMVAQGHQLMDACVGTLYRVGSVLARTETPVAE